MTESPIPPRTEVWAAARADYLAGDSAAVVAERHGLSERSLHRRAAVEGWRRADRPHLAEPPVWSRPVSKETFMTGQPELAEIEAAHTQAMFELLFDPDPGKLRRFAFHKAAELAAMDSPQQAIVWLRLTQLVDRCGDRVAREEAAFQPVDHLRAAFLRHLGQEVGEGEATVAPDAAP